MCAGGRLPAAAPSDYREEPRWGRRCHPPRGASRAVPIYAHLGQTLGPIPNQFLSRSCTGSGRLGITACLSSNLIRRRQFRGEGKGAGLSQLTVRTLRKSGPAMGQRRRARALSLQRSSLPWAINQGHAGCSLRCPASSGEVVEEGQKHEQGTCFVSSERTV